MKGLIHKSKVRPLVLGAVVAFSLVCGGCRSKIDRPAVVKIARVPDVSPGGPEKLEYIVGVSRTRMTSRTYGWMKRGSFIYRQSSGEDAGPAQRSASRAAWDMELMILSFRTLRTCRHPRS